MKDLLIGIGIGFVVGAIMVKTNKPVEETVGKGIEKSKEIIEDISEEVKNQTNSKSKKQKSH